MLCFGSSYLMIKIKNKFRRKSINKIGLLVKYSKIQSYSWNSIISKQMLKINEKNRIEKSFIIQIPSHGYDVVSFWSFSICFNFIFFYFIYNYAVYKIYIHLPLYIFQLPLYLIFSLTIISLIILLNIVCKACTVFQLMDIHYWLGIHLLRAFALSHKSHVHINIYKSNPYHMLWQIPFLGNESTQQNLLYVEARVGYEWS